MIWQRIKDFIFSHHYFGLLKRFLKSIRFHKSQITLFDIIKIFIHKIQQDDILERSSAVAFSFTLAIFPAIIFIFTLIPYFDIPNLDVQIMQFLQDWLPPSMYSAVSSTIEDIISRPRGGLLSFGFFFAIFLATNGMIALIKAFNSCYKTVENRGFFKTRFIATGLTAMLGFMFIFAVVLIIIGQLVIDGIMEFGLLTDDFLIYLILFTRFVVMFIVFFLGISGIYYFAPAIKYRWSFFSVGALISTLLSLTVTYGFSYYISSFGTYNKFYGSIGALIAMMIWLYLLSITMLVGYEINASVHKIKMEVRDVEEGNVAVV